MRSRINWLYPLSIFSFITFWTYLNAQFKEPPGLEWYAFFFFGFYFILQWQIGWMINDRLNITHPWEEGKLKRVSLQLLITTTIGVVLFLIIFIFLNLYENSFAGKDNPLHLIHIGTGILQALIITQIYNGFQLFYSLVQETHKLQKHLADQQQQQILERVEEAREMAHLTYNRLITDQNNPVIEENIPDLIDNLKTNTQKIEETLAGIQKTYESGESQNKYSSNSSNRKRFLVKIGQSMRVVMLNEILLFHKDAAVMLYTTKGQKYVMDHSLDELMMMLPAVDFFRINRQTIVHIKEIKEIRQEGKYVSVHLKHDTISKPLLVSHRTISQFKEWLENGNQ